MTERRIPLDNLIDALDEIIIFHVSDEGNAHRLSRAKAKDLIMEFIDGYSVTGRVA